MKSRRLPLVITMVLSFYVVFALAWKFTDRTSSPGIYPTRTARPTFDVEAMTDADALVVATVTSTPTDTPTAALTRRRPTATATATETATVAPTVTPTPTPVMLVHRISVGETIWGVSLRYGIDYQDLLAANPDVSPDVLWEGQEILIPVLDGSETTEGAPTHIVGEGETVWGIALQYGVEYAELLRINGLGADSVIRPDDELIVPER